MAESSRFPGRSIVRLGNNDGVYKVSVKAGKPNAGTYNFHNIYAYLPITEKALKEWHQNKSTNADGVQLNGFLVALYQQAKSDLESYRSAARDKIEAGASPKEVEAWLQTAILHPEPSFKKDAAPRPQVDWAVFSMLKTDEERQAYLFEAGVIVTGAEAQPEAAEDLSIEELEEELEDLERELEQ